MQQNGLLKNAGLKNGFASRPPVKMGMDDDQQHLSQMEQGHIDDDKVDAVAAYRQSKSTPFIRQVKYFQTLLGFTFSLVLCGLVLLVPISLLPWTNYQQGSNLPVLNEYTLSVGLLLSFGIMYMLMTFFNIASYPTKLFPHLHLIQLPPPRFSTLWAWRACSR